MIGYCYLFVTWYLDLGALSILHRNWQFLYGQHYILLILRDPWYNTAMSDQKSPKKGKSAVGFLREVRGEVRHITWPNRQETVRMTMIVIGITAAVSLYLGGLDYIYTYLMGLII